MGFQEKLDLILKIKEEYEKEVRPGYAFNDFQQVASNPSQITCGSVKEEALILRITNKCEILSYTEIEAICKTPANPLKEAITTLKKLNLSF